MNGRAIMMGVMGVVALGACGSGGGGANAKPADPCAFNEGDGVEYWARVDGPAACADPNMPDTLLRFTGSRWDEEGARCRATDAWFGVTPTANELAVRVERDLDVPKDTFGYCLIHGGTDSELVAYALCGQPQAGRGACENALGMHAHTAITASWHACPGSPECP